MWGADFSYYSTDNQLVYQWAGEELQAAGWSQGDVLWSVSLATRCLVVESVGPLNMVGVTTSVRIEFDFPSDAVEAIQLSSSNTTIETIVDKAGVECSPVRGAEIEGTFRPGSRANGTLEGTFEVTAQTICEVGKTTLHTGRMQLANGWFQARSAPTGLFPPAPDDPWWTQ